MPPGDHEALARALRGLADDRERAKALGEAGARRVRDTGDCGRLLNELQALYDRVAPVRAAPRSVTYAARTIEPATAATPIPAASTFASAAETLTRSLKS